MREETDSHDYYRGFAAIQRQNATLGNVTRETNIGVDLVRIRVALFAASERKALLRSDFMLELAHPKPKLRPTSLWRWAELNGFILRAYHFLPPQTDADPSALEGDYKVWEGEAAAFVQKHYNQEEASRFLFERKNTSTLQRPLPRTFDERVTAQIAMLDGLAEKPID
jgi:hypothetical protein